MARARASAAAWSLAARLLAGCLRPRFELRECLLRLLALLLEASPPPSWLAPQRRDFRELGAILEQANQKSHVLGQEDEPLLFLLQFSDGRVRIGGKWLQFDFKPFDFGISILDLLDLFEDRGRARAVAC